MGQPYHTLIIVSYDDGLVCAQHKGSNDARKLKDYTGDFIIYNMYQARKYIMCYNCV